ncbi:MAG: hypothetical protein M1482_04700, partial [Chloroflexi bacterium]|nr:hypothetical protein [Chloroflexota bacterium]
MKTLRLAVLALIGLGLLVALSVMAVAADSPATNAIPAAATYFDNQPHAIAANSSLWFKFYYSLTYTGGVQETKMSMPYGNASKIGFGIWTPDNVHDLVGKGPFGQGQPQEFPCNGTWCQGDDLIWAGSLGATGWYYVQVTNYNSYDTTENLQISGA